MTSLGLDLDGILRAEGRFAPDARPVPLARIVLCVALGGMAYGAVMGSFGLRPLQMLYSTLKVPLLLLGTSAIVLPSFYVLNCLLGLRDDFAAALRGVFGAQSIMAIALASLAPVDAVGILSTADYETVMRVNFALFGLATLAGHVGCEKFYRPLVLADRRHQIARWAWTVLYVFVGIQLAWVCRPFVGDPGAPTTFLRDDAWSNAYVVVARKVLHLY